MQYTEYVELCPDGPEEQEFQRLDWQARRIMDRATTGVDGVRKLSVAPPTDEYAVDAVRRCEAALVKQLWWMDRTESYVNREDETVTGRVVTAITAGSESMSFAMPQNAGMSQAEREACCRQTVAEYLAGVADANGVNLLYMGAYPVKVGG